MKDLWHCIWIGILIVITFILVAMTVFLVGMLCIAFPIILLIAAGIFLLGTIIGIILYKGGCNV